MAAVKQSRGLRVTVAAAIFGLLFLVAARGEFVNSSGHDSQASLEAVAVTVVNGGQDTIAAASVGDLVSSPVELDAIRLEIIMLRRFVVIIGGIFFGWLAMVQLFKSH